MPTDRWFRMTSKQRQSHLAKVVSTPLSECFESDNTTCTYSLNCNSSRDKDEVGIAPLEVSAKDAEIHSMPIDALEGIWHKAAELLSKPGLVADAPSTSSSNCRCFVVASQSSQRPRIVQQGKSGQFSCEPSCPMWQSSKICSHSVAAAQFSRQLNKFISWYKKSRSEPSLERLAKVGMPRGSGRKGEKPPRKRSKTAKPAPLSMVERNVSSISGQSNTSQVSSLSPSTCQSVNQNMV